MTISNRVRVKNVSVLSDRRYRLNEVEFEYRRGNGQWQTQKREVFDRGHAATLLPYNLANRTVVLTRQFRLPPYLAGHDDLMIEAAAGMLDDETAENRIRAEAEEEIGLDPKGIRVLGRLSNLITVTYFRVTPVIGVVRWPAVFRVGAHEVARIFTMPLAWLANPSNRWQFEIPGTDRSLIAYHPYD